MPRLRCSVRQSRRQVCPQILYAAPRSARSAPWTDQNRGTSRGDNLALVPNPLCAQAAPDCWRWATRAAASMHWSDCCRRRCGPRTWACRRTGSAAGNYGLGGRCLAGFHRKKRASAGTEAVQRKEEKYDSATIAHDRVIRRQFLVIGQRPWRPRSSSTRWTSTVGTEFTLRRGRRKNASEPVIVELRTRRHALVPSGQDR